MRVIVHGGAGGAPDEPEPRQQTLDDAAAAGADETDVVDAVESAVRVLESSERFNAGVGGAVQSDGIIRTDAGVMVSDRNAGDDQWESPDGRAGSRATREVGDDERESPDGRAGSRATREVGDDERESPDGRAGSRATREAGAAAGMPGVEHAVSVARAVMEETPHIFLNGVHAVDFAEDVGVSTERDLWTDRTREKWDDLDSHPEGSPLEHVEWIEGRFGGNPDDPDDHDTVGAVASDGDAFAAATSTGGRWLALAGRVGDVPQIGSGFYAAPAGAASATGAGEDIAKTTLTRRAVRHLETGLDAQAAADRAIEEFAELTGASAGVIVLDADGNAGEAFNSEEMQTSVV